MYFNPMTASGRPTFRSMWTTQRLVIPPSAEPVSLAEAKKQSLRSASDITQDSEWELFIAAARNQAETDTMRAICWQKRSLTLNEWPHEIELYACPVRSDVPVVITYSDTAGDTQTLATTVYKVRYDLEPARISLKSAQVWPTLLDESGVITVTFTAGYLIPFTVTASTNILTFTDYTPTTGDSFRLSNSGGELPGGLAKNTTYYVISASGSTCKLSASSGGSEIDITSLGTGLHYLGELPSALRMAMLKHLATNFADREGSTVAADCERSYMQSLRAVQYWGGI
jgi:uncharacterized phiE125 gp8 family phage protein